MLLQLLYEIALWLFAIITLPKLLYQSIVHKKYRSSLGQRLGFRWPSIEKKEKLIWIHAVSVGETKAVALLAKKLKDSDTTLIITSTTETGHAEAKRSLPFADHHLYLPLDFRWLIKSIIRRLKPHLLILSETDFWYNFLKSAKECGAMTAVVNGKVSERSLRRFSRLHFFSKPLFSLIDLFCVQNELYKKRFESLGIPSNKFVITGNLKFDEEYPHLSEEEKLEFRKRFNLESKDRIVVVASTHDPEEKLLLKILKEMFLSEKNLRIILAPRHPERFTDVARLIEAESIPFVRYSQMQNSQAQIILLDTMGLVRDCFQIAELAIVGGSFTSKIGGHNILEPCVYGVPVLFGPHMFSQPELSELVKNSGAGFQVTIEELPKTFKDLLADTTLRYACKEAGQKLLIDCKGSATRTQKSIMSCLI